MFQQRFHKRDTNTEEQHDCVGCVAFHMEIMFFFLFFPRIKRVPAFVPVQMHRSQHDTLYGFNICCDDAFVKCVLLW